MDMEDGEIQYRTSLILEDQPLNESLIRPLMGCNIQTMDRYFPGVMKMMFGSGSVEETIGYCERGPKKAAPESANGATEGTPVSPATEGEEPEDDEEREMMMIVDYMSNPRIQRL